MLCTPWRFSPSMYFLLQMPHKHIKRLTFYHGIHYYCKFLKFSTTITLFSVKFMHLMHRWLKNSSTCELKRKSAFGLKWSKFSIVIWILTVEVDSREKLINGQHNFVCQPESNCCFFFFLKNSLIHHAYLEMQALSAKMTQHYTSFCLTEFQLVCQITTSIHPCSCVT